MPNFRLQRIMWITTALTALVAAVIGVAHSSIYTVVVSHDLIPAVIAPDILTIMSSLALIILAISSTQRDVKKHSIIQGILGYFFYNYGVYVIERLYNPLYLAYMAIFALSFWSLIGYVISLRDASPQATLPDRVRWPSIVVALVQPVIFYPLWISQLLPLMTSGTKIEFLYSIYILDLCFIMPAFAVMSYMMIKKQSIGLITAPIIFILGFLVIFSLAITDVIKPYFQAEPGTGSFTSAAALSGLFLIMGIIHLKKLRITHSA